MVADKGGRKVEGEWESQGAPKTSWYIAELLTRGGTVLDELQVPAVEIVSIQKQVKERDGQ